MSFVELQQSIARDAAPPPGASLLVQALWHDARGDWHQAHTCAQDVDDRDGAWVHAYLHRKEGDRGNAGYWYARAGRRMPDDATSFVREWEQIAQTLVA